MIIIKNHLPALTALLAFAYLYVGSLKLIRTPSSGLKPENRVVSTLLFIGGAIAFTWAFANSPTASLQQADGIAVYAVPHDVLLLSLVLPYLFAWLLGLHASMNITAYAKNVKGSIYRQALRRVARGMMVIIIFTIVLQLITVATPILNHMKLGSVILVLYLIITLYGLGAYCITAGARKLTLIEVAQ